MILLSEIERARARYERRLTPEVERILAAQVERIARAAAGSNTPEGMLLNAEREAADTSVAFEVLASIWGTVAPAFAQAVYDAYAPAKDLKDDWLERVLGFLGLRGAEMVVAITDTTRSAIRRIISAGLEEGLGSRVIARNLRTEMDEFSKIRSERIVRTESGAASNYGSLIGAEEVGDRFGIQLEKQWIAGADDRVRDSHADLHNKRTPIDGVFLVDDVYPAEYPGDPSLPPEERINCRCASVFVPSETKAIGFLDRRDTKIRREYEALKVTEPSALHARLELSDRHNLSVGQIERIVWKKVRS